MIFIANYIFLIMDKLKLDNIIEDGKYKGKMISELASNKKAIFELLKNGYNFDDEVLLQAGIKKTVRDIRTRTEVVEHEKDTKVYPKETVSISKILKDLETVVNQSQYYDSNSDVVLKDLSDE